MNRKEREERKETQLSSGQGKKTFALLAVVGGGGSGVALEEKLEEAVGLDRRPQAPQDLPVRLLVSHIVFEENENALPQSLLVHLAMKLGSINGLTVETNDLIRAHVRLRELDPAGTKLADPVVVAQLNMESLGEFSQKRIGDARRRESNRKGADFRSLLILNDGTTAKISQELVAPTGAKNGARVIEQALDDLSQRSREGVFPGDRESPGATDQDGVGVFDVGPSDIRVVDEVDEFKLAPSYSAAIDEAALLLLEGYEFVPDLEEDESELGSRCCHFIL